MKKRRFNDHPIIGVSNVVQAICAVAATSAPFINSYLSGNIPNTPEALQRLLIEVAALCLILAIAFKLLKRRRGSRSPSEHALERHILTKAIACDEKALEDFLETFHGQNGHLAPYKKSIKGIRVDQFEKSFAIIGCNIQVKKRFKMVNCSHHPIRELKVYSYGGSFTHANDLDQTAKRIQTRKKSILNFQTKQLRDRLFETSIYFPAVLPAKSIEIEYNEVWKGAMSYGDDSVLYTDILYFHEQTRRLISRFTFDEPPESLSLYRADLSKWTVEGVNTKIRRINGQNGRWEYQFTVDNPISDFLYFLMICRRQALTGQGDIANQLGKHGSQERL